MCKRNMLKRVSLLCTSVLMSGLLTVTASAKVQDDNIVMEVPAESDFISINEESFEWEEGWGASKPMKGRVNCVKEGAKLSFTAKRSSEVIGDIVLTVHVYALGEDGKTIQYVSDIIYQEKMTEEPTIVDFESSNFKNLNLMASDITYGESEDYTSRKDCLYVLSFSDYGDLPSEEVVYVARIGGETSNSSVAPSDNKIPKLSISKIMVNGKDASVRAYEIDGSNYFALRDFAMLVDGTDKQFEVGFDANKNSISLTSGKPYTAVGGELTININDDTQAKTTSKADVKITVDGKEVNLTAYNIGGNNYFKLRDIAKAANINVKYDTATGTIDIDTSSAYTE